jgi:excinuclease ABC subunit B
VGQSGRAGGVKAKQPVPRLGERAGEHAAELAGLPSSDLAALIQDLTDQMRAAAAELQFELAARLRDEISELRKELRQMVEATK